MAARGKAAASRKGAAAARAERNGKPVEVDFHGVTLQLPPKLPNSFALRFARIAAKEEKGEVAVGEIYNLLVPQYLSDEKYDEVLEAVDQVSEDVGLVDLVVAIGGSYGDVGESAASASS